MVWYGKDRLLVSGRVEQQSASWAMDRSGSARFVVHSIALNKCVDLACSAAILLQYASRSCRHLHVGMLVAGDLQGYVVTNRKSCAPFSSVMFPDHGTRMSFAARGYKAHIVFAPFELPFSDEVVTA